MNRAQTLALFAALGSVMPACSLSQNGVTPHPDTISYPAGAVTDPAGNWLFVANSNADLRYNDGTLVSLDLQSAMKERANPEWLPCPKVDYLHPYTQPTDTTKPVAPFCCWDRLDPNILNCDEQGYITSDNTVRLGSFAAGMVWIDPQCPTKPACPRNCDPAHAPWLSTAPARIAIAVRGDASLTYLNINGTNPPVPDCGNTGPFGECDQAHRITQTFTPAAVLEGDTTASSATILRLPDEPYTLALDRDSNLLYLGHLTGDISRAFSGGISLFDVTPTQDNTPPLYLSSFQSPFSSNASGLFGVTSFTVKPHDPNNPNDTNPAQIYATSRYVANVTSVSPIIVDPNACGDPNRQVVVVGTGGDLNTTLNGTETRGVQFVPAAKPGDVDRTFVLQRIPPALVVFDNGNTSTPTSIIELCDSPTFLYQHNAAHTGVRLFVNCAGTNEIYVIDPTLPDIVATFSVGRGPAGMVFPGGVDDAQFSTTAFVLDFNDNNVSVVDLQPGSDTQYHVIQRLGFGSTTPR
jgi:hypothetical protein